MHPTLVKVLAAWKLSGFTARYGRKPTAADFIVPTRNMTAVKPHGTMRDANEAQRQLAADLALLGLRVKAGAERDRRGHDMRRTFISLARTDGAIDGPLWWVTHGPNAKAMIEQYSTFTWDALCTEVAKLKISLREGALIALRTADGTPARWLKTADGDAARKQASSASWPTSGQRTRSESNKPRQLAVLAALNVATPTGFEPVLPA